VPAQSLDASAAHSADALSQRYPPSASASTHGAASSTRCAPLTTPLPVNQTTLRFANASPQSTNLALNTVEEPRTDWVNLLLGDENSRSSFDPRRGYGRLMTAAP
jgi:hypothetical protein